MEMLAIPNIKTRGTGRNGKKGCRQKKGMSGKLADIDVSVRHVAGMSLTFPTKPESYYCIVGFLAPSQRYSTLVEEEACQL